MIVRPGKLEDSRAIASIFNHYIDHSNARFETEPMSDDQITGWMAQFGDSAKHRLFVAVDKRKVVAGFACTQRYRDIIAFERTVEATIYLKPDLRASGIGTRLYESLFDSISTTGVHRILAGIALPNDRSVALHRKFGFREVGIFDEYAKKNGEYISSIWMQKCV